MGLFYSFVAQSMGKIDPSSQDLGGRQTQPLHGHRVVLRRPVGVELPLEHDHDGQTAFGRAGAAGRLLHQGQRPAARHRHPGRGDLERRHELQHHRRDRGRSGAVVWPGPGGHDGRPFWGVFIWKEFQKAPPGTNQLLAAMFAFYLLGLGILIASKL